MQRGIKHNSMLLLWVMRGSVFKIVLSNGFAWKIQGTTETAGWLREMAEILSVILEHEDTDADLRVERVAFEAGASIAPLTLLDHFPLGSVSPDKWCVRAWSDLILISHEDLPYMIAGLAEVSHREGQTEQMRRVMLPFYEAVTEAGGFPLHAALVEIDGQGVLIAGVSGAGKSTCCRRLPLPWRTLGDDMAIVVPCSNGTFQAHPLPTWSVVKTRIVDQPCVINHSVPVWAIFFLAHSDVDEAVPISGARAALSIYDAAMQVFMSVDHSAHIPGGSTYKRILFENTAAMASAVPAFSLRVSLQGRFWAKIEAILEKEKGEGLLLYRGDHVSMRRAPGGHAVAD